MVDKSFSNWEIFYFVANYALALIAVVGFWASMKTSKKIQDSVNLITKSLVSFTDPLIKVKNTTWMLNDAGTSDGTNKISKNNPPKGIMVHYVNASRIPIQLENTDLKVFYGEKLFDEPVADMYHPEISPTILAPGEEKVSGTMQSESFEKYLGKPKNIFQPPHLNFVLEMDFSTFDGQKYRYETKHEVFFNIEDPSNKMGRVIYERLKRIV